jgi:hypothetical protein
MEESWHKKQAEGHMNGLPLAIDLYCGLGGWTDGLLAEGYDVLGFDIERHEYGEHRYPAQLVIQDVLTLHGSQFKDATLIVASPPCQEYSYMAMPWTRAKAKAAAIRTDTSGAEIERLNALFNACFRIQREACEAAGRHIPMIVENVRGAIPWVGRSRWNFGSFHLWGDIPALMPPVSNARKFNPDRLDHPTKNTGGSWFDVAHNTTSGKSNNPVSIPACRNDGAKLPGFRFDGSGKSFQSASVEGVKGEGVKQHGSGREWFAGEGKMGRLSSKSPARKMASAMIAKIPLALSRHIARAWFPQQSSEAA